jgi:hypothetical protein
LSLPPFLLAGLRNFPIIGPLHHLLKDEFVQEAFAGGHYLQGLEEQGRRRISVLGDESSHQPHDLLPPPSTNSE